MTFGPFKNFAARASAALLMFAGLGFNAAHAGIPVIDGTNLTQNIMTAVQTAESYAQQIQQYGTQLSQYEQEIKNSVAPAAYLWDQATSTITKLTNVINTVENLRNSNGALDSYLNNFKNASYYSNSPCFTGTGCAGSTYNSLLQNSITAGDTSKAANDALLKSLDQQQAQLQADAASLQSLQLNATTAVGQMSAIQSANQLASNASNNMLQIRGLLIAQQQATAAKRAAELDQQAREAASTAYVRSASFTASTPVSY